MKYLIFILFPFLLNSQISYHNTRHEVLDYYGYATGAFIVSALSYEFIYEGTNYSILKSDLTGTAAGILAANVLERGPNGRFIGSWGALGNGMFYFPVYIQYRINYKEKHKKKTRYSFNN